ncbi:hypothetical protein ABTA43_20190, partial [Acinetobacter baumannii]
LAALSFIATARADDAYVCDGGRLVYARPETLDKLKQTDPCIMQYYGLKPPQPAATASVTPIVAAAAPAVLKAAPIAKAAPTIP